MSEREKKQGQEFRSSSLEDAMRKALGDKVDRAQEWQEQQETTLTDEETENLRHKREAESLDRAEEAFDHDQRRREEKLKRRQRQKENRVKGSEIAPLSTTETVTEDQAAHMEGGTVPEVEHQSVFSEPHIESQVFDRAGVLDYLRSSAVHSNESDETKASWGNYSDTELQGLFEQTKTIEEMGMGDSVAETGEQPESVQSHEPAGEIELAKTEEGVESTPSVDPVISPEAAAQLPAPEAPVEPVSTVEAEQAETPEPLSGKVPGVLPHVRVSFKGKDDKDLKDQILAVTNPENEPAEWKGVAEVEGRLRSKFGIEPARWRYTPDQHIETLQRLESFMEALPDVDFSGIRFKVGNNSDPHDRDTIMVDPESSQEEIEMALMPQIAARTTAKKAQAPVASTAAPETAKNPAITASGANKDGGKEKGASAPVQAIPGVTKLPGSKSRPVVNNASENNPIPDLELKKLPQVIGNAFEVPDPVESRLEKARNSYVKARRSIDDLKALNALRSKLKTVMSGESQDALELAHQNARAEYEKTRLEYVGTNIERHLEEKLAMTQSHLENYGQMESGMAKRAEKAWTKLGEMNFNNVLKYWNKESKYKTVQMAARSLSVRNAIYAGLLLSGNVGAAAALRTASGYWGTIKLAERFRQARAHEQLQPDQITAIKDLSEIHKEQARILMLASFDGNLDELKNRADFKLLQEQEKALIAVLPQERQAQIMAEEGGIALQYFDDQIKREKSGKAKSKIVGAVGAAVAGGAVSKALDYYDLNSVGDAKVSAAERPSIETPPAKPNVKDVVDDTPSEPVLAKTPATPQTDALHSSETVDVTPNAEETDSVESAADGEKINTIELVKEYDGSEAAESVADAAALPELSVVEAGSRGLEGSLNDLKDSDPEKYAAIVKWLNEQYPDSGSTPENLIHRMVKRLAEEKGYTVDGSVNNISDVQSAAIKLKNIGDGRLAMELDAASIKLAGEEYQGISRRAADHIFEQRAATQNISPDATSVNTIELVDNQPTIGPEEIEVEKLNFEDLKPTDGDSVDSISSIHADAAESAAEAAEEIDLEQAIESVKNEDKTSKALESLLGKDGFKKFREEVYDFDSRRLNKIQHVKVSEFIDFYKNPETSQAHIRGYKKLSESVYDLLRRSSEEERDEIRNGNLRDLLIRLAAERLKK